MARVTDIKWVPIPAVTDAWAEAGGTQATLCMAGMDRSLTTLAITAIAMAAGMDTATQGINRGEGNS